MLSMSSKSLCATVARINSSAFTAHWSRTSMLNSNSQMLHSQHGNHGNFPTLMGYVHDITHSNLMGHSINSHAGRNMELPGKFDIGVQCDEKRRGSQLLRQKIPFFSLIARTSSKLFQEITKHGEISGHRK